MIDSHETPNYCCFLLKQKYRKKNLRIVFCHTYKSYLSKNSIYLCSKDDEVGNEEVIHDHVVQEVEVTHEEVVDEVDLEEDVQTEEVGNEETVDTDNIDKGIRKSYPMPTRNNC